jgi:hypothetical protein
VRAAERSSPPEKARARKGAVLRCERGAKNFRTLKRDAAQQIDLIQVEWLPITLFLSALIATPF